MNEAGVRAKNQWISVENEDDVDVNGEDVDTLWYYFGDNGKAYKADTTDLKKKDCPDSTGTRTYFFDSEGHMVSGWVTYDSEYYYCGTENEGWAYTGWQYLEPDEDLSSEEYDDLVWFNFKSSGKARKSTTWYSKGRYYTFDQFGVMKDDWYTADLSAATNGSATSSDANAYTTEDGTKGTGWVYADTVDENDTKWFYLVSVTTVDANGTKIVRNIPFNSINSDTWRAKVIKGKTYVFNTKGEMQDGLQTFTKALPEDNKGGASSKKLAAGTYYFNEGDGSVNGQMVTGKTTVTADGETYYFYFDSKTGRAITDVVKDGIVYGHDGDRIDAEDGNSNEKVVLTHDVAYSKAKNGVIPAGSEIIVSSAGKLRTSGTVKVDGVKYVVTVDAETGVWSAPKAPNQD